MTKFTPFRVFYNSAYSILGICLIGLLIITPADCIKQCLSNHQIYNIFVIAGCYVLTIILGGLIYTSRILTTRAVLSAIPKQWIPVEKGDVNKKVREMIVAGWNRNAIIAWDAKPHVEQQALMIVSSPGASESTARSNNAEIEARKNEDQQLQVTKEGDHIVVVSPEPRARVAHAPIVHDGWSSPASPDLPNLEYSTVILELPHLIEARAVSLAPTNPDSNPAMPDLRAVEILQRPPSMGLRDYITHLTSFGIIPNLSSSMSNDFLASYEYARFSTKALSELQFRELMKKFAELLRIMQSLSVDVLDNLEPSSTSDITGDDDDVDDGASFMLMISRNRSMDSPQSLATNALTRTESEGTIDHQSLRRAQDPDISADFAATSTSPQRGRMRSPISTNSNANHFTQSRTPYFDAGSNGSSSQSLISRASQGSVIKLSRNIDRDEAASGELPYTLTIPRVR